MHKMLAEMQASMSAQVEQVNIKYTELLTRFSAFEEKHSESPPIPHHSANSETATPAASKRLRRNPLSLQVS